MIINEFKKLWRIHYLKWVVVAALILNALVAHGGVAISHDSYHSVVFFNNGEADGSSAEHLIAEE